MPGPREVQNLQMPHPRDWQGVQMPLSSPGGGEAWAQVELTDALFLVVDVDFVFDFREISKKLASLGDFTVS